MAKRKREEPAGSTGQKPPKRTLVDAQSSSDPRNPTLQIITGSYERTLHGFTASISRSTQNPDAAAAQPTVDFTDSFLFNAHTSAVRCLALSPPTESEPNKPQRVTLASGGTDERINLYNLSTSPPAPRKGPALPTLSGPSILENPRNKELGSLLHHSSTVNALYFPTRSKLLSAADDNTVAVTRTRDWTVVSTIKAPLPKAYGRPEGDTAPPGGTPAGVVDFAVHPSMKLMLTVGKGEKCMRLWNLVTGKKAGVLNFGKDLLQGVGEGRWASGEGRRIEWNSSGNEFAVAFERGVVIFGVDSKPKCKIMPGPRTKIHQMRYLSLANTDEEDEELLAVSTEDGRIIFYSTRPSVEPQTNGSATSKIPDCQAKGQLGGNAAGLSSRVKDFEIVRLPASESWPNDFLIVAGSSDGAVRIWSVAVEELHGNLKTSAKEAQPKDKSLKDATNGESASVIQVGQHLGLYETGGRITCLKAFLMSGARANEDALESAEAEENGEEDQSSESTSEDE